MTMAKRTVAEIDAEIAQAVERWLDLEPLDKVIEGIEAMKSYVIRRAEERDACRH
jgi:hypothetical protein